jgi:phage gpG-like protein
MISLFCRTTFNSRHIRRKAKDGSIKNLAHAGAAIRLTARRSIRKSKAPSTPGTPPHTRKGQLRRSILYAVEKNKTRVVIGPAHNIAGTSGMAHEFGGRYRKERFPQRSFMGPALMKQKDRLPKMWAGSVR